VCGAIKGALKRKTRKDTRITFYKVVIVDSIFMYGSENLVLHRSETTEIRLLRSVSGCTLTDKVRNAKICSSCGLEERIQGYKSKRHNHILRMESSRLTRNVKNYQPDRRRNVG
jgi:hypothetical protein